MSDPSSRPVRIIDGLVAENVHAINQLADLLEVLPGGLYRRSFGAGKQHVIGKHVRHIIDHYQTLIRAVSDSSTAPLNYENRQREAVLERDNHAARRQLLSIGDVLVQVTHSPTDAALRMEHVADDQRGLVVTTVERELVFLSSHTIHHMAIIAMLAEQAGVAVPEGFGVHPSTLRHCRSMEAPMVRSA